MLGFTDVVLGALTLYAYKLWKGKKTPSAKSVPWPKEGKTMTTPAAPSPAANLSPTDKFAIAQQTAQQGLEQTKFDAQLAEAKAKAAGDKKAQADIAAKAKARQKALDDWKRDIEAAQRGEGRG